MCLGEAGCTQNAGLFGTSCASPLWGLRENLLLANISRRRIARNSRLLRKFATQKPGILSARCEFMN